MSDEVAGLPEGGPATLAAVRARLGLPANADPADPDNIELEPIVEAVNDQVRTWPVAERSADPEAEPEDRTWKRSTVLGADMLCHRLYSRRNSPDGVAGFADGAPVYVQRNAPDIAMMLQLGQWAKPAVC